MMTKLMLSVAQSIWRRLAISPEILRPRMLTVSVSPMPMPKPLAISASRLMSGVPE